MSIIRRMVVEAFDLHDSNPKLALKLIKAAMESDDAQDFVEDERDLVELEAELDEMDEEDDSEEDPEDDMEDEEDDSEEDPEAGFDEEEYEDVESEDEEDDSEEDMEDEEDESEAPEMSASLQAKILATANKYASTGKKSDAKLARKLLASIQ